MSGKLKIERGSGNVFVDIGFPPDEAHNLLLRSEMMTRIELFVKRSGLTQSQAAKLLGMTQPRLNALLKGKIGLFSLDALVNAATRAGFDVALRVSPVKKKSAEGRSKTGARKLAGESRISPPSASR
jgi:predicted XRE-type DNA-binding protein